MGECVSFHNLTLPEGLLCAASGEKPWQGMPESVVREELESLDIRVQGVTQLHSGRCEQDLAKDRPHNPHFIVYVVRGPEMSKVRSITELCSLGVSMES